MNDVVELEKNFKENLPTFNIIGVDSLDSGEIVIRVRKKTLAEYCRRNFPNEIEFKSGNEVYNVEKFYINVNNSVKMVFVIRKNNMILSVISLYECEHSDCFANEYLNMSIDEIIRR